MIAAMMRLTPQMRAAAIAAVGCSLVNVAEAASACVEHIPEGKTRPAMTDTFPSKARAGYATTLRLSIPHGVGEHVLPGGFKLLLDSAEGRELTRSGFVFADVEGPAAPRIERREQNGQVVTVVELNFIPLPKESGRQILELPSVPIAIARASGDLATLCTAPHSLQVEDPTANLVEAQPRGNPAPVIQREVWTAAKNVALGALVALPLGIFLAFLVGWWRRRERVAPPPPPPRPAWDTALAALARLRGLKLLEQGRTREHFAQVSQAVRQYLGERYGFDGLESTTSEMLQNLRHVRPGIDPLPDIVTFLDRADLVKFANLTPEAAECENALDEGERLVRQTMDTMRRELEAAAAGQPLVATEEAVATSSRASSGTASLELKSSEEQP